MLRCEEQQLEQHYRSAFEREKRDLWKQILMVGGMAALMRPEEAEAAASVADRALREFDKRFGPAIEEEIADAKEGVRLRRNAYGTVPHVHPLPPPP